MRQDKVEWRAREIVSVGGHSRLLLSAVAALAVLFFPVLAAKGAGYSWQAMSGDWSSTANWSGRVLPTSNDTAYVVNGGTLNITKLGETCGTLSLGSSTENGTVQMTGGSLSTVSFQSVGNSGTGTFTQSGGTNTIAVDLYVGKYAGSSGTYNLSGNSQMSTAWYEYVGYSGTGTFTQLGGVKSSNYLDLGYNAGSSGTYNLGGGQLSVNWLSVGISGSATFIQSGGTNNLANGSLGIGGGTGSSATYSLDGGQILANNELVSGVGTAIFSQSGGINTVTEDQLALGGNTGNAGSYYLSGSGQMSINFELVGEYGSSQ